MKKSVLRRPVSIAAGVLLSAALIGGASSPAFAAAWTGENVIIGDKTFEINTDFWGVGHVDGWDGSSALGDTFTHESGTLEFENPGFDDDGVVCDTTVQAATKTVDAAGNVTVACEADELTLYPGIWVTPELYFYAEGDLVRVFYTIENRSAAGITIDDMRLVDDWDDDTDYAEYTTNIGDFVSEDLVAADTAMRWQMGGYLTDDSFTTLVADQTLFGSAWRLDGNTTFGTTDAEMQQSMSHKSIDVVVAAGAKIYVASYATYSYVSTLPEAEAGYDDMVAFMSLFDSFSGRLLQGLPECIEIANWGPTTCPALPDTGLDASIAWSIATVGMALLVAGGALIVLRRRTAN